MSPVLPGRLRPGGLLVAFPLYKLVSAEFFRSWLRVDKSCVVDTISINHVYVVDAFERLVENALMHPGWDRLVFVEQDMVLPLHGLTRMAHCDDGQGVVCGAYFKHQVPHDPIAYFDGPDGVYRAVSGARFSGWLEEPGLYEVDGVGFGFTSVARCVLEGWDWGLSLFLNDERVGHDLWFCRQARLQGHRVFVDTAVQCGHLSEVRVGVEECRRHL